MPNIAPGPPALIQDPLALKTLLKRLEKQAAIAVDTESNSLHAYKEQVCLIQLTIPGKDYLVDPLSLDNLNGLGRIFAAEHITKVLHGAEYDVLCLGRDFGFQLNNLFDTRVASRTLGWKKSGLGDLLERVFNVRLDKRFQRANWGKRPIPEEMLDYARLDTHYLLELRARLLADLKQRQLEEQVLEMCAWMTLVPPSENGFDPDGYWRISHARELNQRQMAILRELYLMRDKLARDHDRPAFKILNDSALLAIARHAPRSEDQLRSPTGLTKRQVERFARAILPAVQRGKKAPIPRKPRGNHRDEAMINRYEALREWRKAIARDRKVESDIILPRDLMETLARQPPGDKAELRSRMHPLEWRFRIYGADILKLLAETDL